MTPDPAAALARFTPVGPDPAELLVRVGRATAPTRRRWKLAVLALVLTNAAAVGWIAFRPAAAAPEVITVVVPVPVVIEPPIPPPEPSSLAVLRGRYDLGPAATLVRVAPGDPPLTPLAARRGEFD
jgi:hypothetical protein